MRSPKVLAVRNIKRADEIRELIGSEDFKRAWEYAGGRGNKTSYRAEVCQMIVINDVHGVRWWLECMEKRNPDGEY